MNKRGIPILIIAALLLLAGGVIWAANAGGSDDSTSGVQAEASATIAVTPASTAPPTATEQPLPTDPPATATLQPPVPTATPPPTSPPALAPPPPRPDQLTPVEDAILAGGQWYEYDSCTAFYLPAGRTFIIHMALNDPGGFFTLALEDEATGSTIAFSYDDGGERNRTVNVPEAGPLLDQIADTFSKDC